MKHVKKLFSVILVLIMALTMVLPVAAAGSADDGNTLTINSKTSGHTYQAYQVFTGKLDSTGKILSDIGWSSQVDQSKVVEGKTLLAAVQSLEKFKECKTALDIAKVLGDNRDNAELVDQFAAVISKYVTGTPKTSGEPAGDATNGYVYTISGLADGYYFVTEAVQDPETDNSYTKYMLQVVGNTTVSAKTDVPSAVKKVQENSPKYNTDEGYGTGYNDVADYNIGDTVPFAFYSKVPDMSNFKTYKYIFHDDMSEGLDFNVDSVNVWIGGMELTKDDEYRVVESTALGAGHSHTRGFDVVIDDLKAVAMKHKVAIGSDIRVDFTATLNTEAQIGLPGNPNTLTLEYSNNPNDESKTTTGTPDSVIVFTYELDVTKVDGDTLDANGKVIDTTTMLDGVEFKLYKKVTENGVEAEKYVNVNTNGRVTGWSDTEDGGTVLTTAADGPLKGKFMVIGLDDGEYYLKETQPKDGYNTIKEPIKVTVTATTTNGQSWTNEEASDALTALAITIGEGSGATVTSGDTGTGIVSTIVENFQGIQLPGTGGIGTTIFYVVGGILVLGAAVLLIARKRTKM